MILCKAQDGLRKSKRIADQEVSLPTPEPSSQVEVRIENDSTDPHLKAPSSPLAKTAPVTPIKTFGRGSTRKRVNRTASSSSPSVLDLIEVKKDEPPAQQYHIEASDQGLNISSDDETDVPTRRARVNRSGQRTARNGRQCRPLPVESSSEEDSEAIQSGSTRRRTRKHQGRSYTPQDGKLFFTKASTQMSRKTPSRSSQRDGSAHRNLRPQSTPESNDSDDSLMDELRNSTTKSVKTDKGNKNGSKHLSARSTKDPPSQRRQRPRTDDSSSLLSPEGESDLDLESQSDDEIPHSARRDADPHCETLVANAHLARRSHLKRVIKPTVEKTARQLQLDQLRQRRADEPVIEVSDTSSDSDILSDNATANEISDPDEDSGTERIRQAITFNLDEYEEDFVDDEDDTIGVPANLEEIPLEFTRHANKKPIEHFKDVVEWMVHNKLNPAFARDDPVYRLAVQKLDDAAQGFAGSKFISAAWRPEFSAALKMYPELASTAVPTMMEHKCEACGRSGHPAKHQLIFSGKPYHRTSLEDVSSDDDSDGSNREEQSRAFLLGSTCNANAEIGHALHHWRHQLNQFVLDLLRAEGHTTPEKIIQREGWSVKKREKYANGVVDGMEADGQMRELYKEFKENLEAAREAK
ncbi:MAG: hypothetical protein Q9222_007380, partial [Ikaeria aurantiellina]